MVRGADEHAIVLGVDLWTTTLPVLPGRATADRQLAVNEHLQRARWPVVPGRNLRIDAVAAEDFTEAAARKQCRDGGGSEHADARDHYF